MERRRDGRVGVLRHCHPSIRPMAELLEAPTGACVYQSRQDSVSMRHSGSNLLDPTLTLCHPGIKTTSDFCTLCNASTPSLSIAVFELERCYVSPFCPFQSSHTQLLHAITPMVAQRQTTVPVMPLHFNQHAVGQRMPVSRTASACPQILRNKHRARRHTCEGAVRTKAGKATHAHCSASILRTMIRRAGKALRSVQTRTWTCTTASTVLQAIARCIKTSCRLQV